MPLLPAAASLAAAHEGRIKNIRATTLRETNEKRNPGVVILTLRKKQSNMPNSTEISLATQVHTVLNMFVHEFTNYTAPNANHLLRLTYRNHG